MSLRFAPARARRRAIPCRLAVAFFATLFVLAGGPGARAQEARVVTVASEPQQKMAYGMDFERLWSWKGLKERTRLAEFAVRDCKVDYVRVAINGGAEPKEGTFDASAYDDILEVMTVCQAARPDIKFFGSPRPINEAIKDAPWGCYPTWIGAVTNYTNSKGERKWKPLPFEPEKAGDYMVRYVRFMKSKGFTISYLDLKNECCPKYRPAGLAVMAARIRKELGKDAPLLIAPSGFDYIVGGAWVKEAMDGPAGTNFFDILSTHNTRGEKSGPLEDFVALGAKLGKPVWNTELHGWRGNDAAAASNTVILFHQIRTGVGTLNDWLSLGNEKKDYKMFRTMNNGSLEVMRIYYIYKQLVNTSSGGRYVPTTVPAGLTSSAAFLKGDLMTVWLLNGTAVPAPGIRVDLGRTIADNELKTVWWGPANGREGTVGKAKPATEKSLVADVGAQTLICFEFKVK